MEDRTTRAARVSWLVTVTVAPGMATPLGSRTVPAIRPADWADAGAATRAINTEQVVRMPARSGFMGPPFSIPVANPKMTRSPDARLIRPDTGFVNKNGAGRSRILLWPAA